MLKKILKILRNVFISIILLYSLNILLEPLNINIPINIINILVLSILGIPSLVSLIIILLIVYWKEIYVRRIYKRTRNTI